MNKETFLNNDVETNVSEEEIVLAPPVELFDEAKEIAKTTVSDEKFPFMLHYDANQKEHLLSMLGMVGAIVEDDDDDGHILATMMNMTQLAFIKRLDCVERVKTDEGEVRNPFLMEDAAQPAATAAAVASAIPMEMDTMQTEPIMTSVANDGIAVASASAGARSSCGSSSSCGCPTNTSMATAREINVESIVSGNICCPGAEQWFKFTVPQSKEYTIYTTGSLDTVGTLYDCCGNELATNDDYAGRVNFRIIRELTQNTVYYLKVKANKNATGGYDLKITQKRLPTKVTINMPTIVLAKDVLYELPTTPNYTYTGRNGAIPIEGLEVSIDPADAFQQIIWWHELSDLLTLDCGWDNGNLYMLLRGTQDGIATLDAEDLGGFGRRDECTVVIKSREQITVKRDGMFNKIVFENSGKTWYSLNFDYVNNWTNLNNNDLKMIRDRLYRSTYTTVNWDNGWAEVTGVKLYSEKEMKLLYVLDPLGFASYVQEYAKHVYSGLLDKINFKDSVFTILFGRAPKYYARTTAGEWYDATSEKNTLSIHKILSEAELLFGTHPIYDYTTIREIFATVIQILTLPVSFASLANVAVPIAYKVFLKCMNLTFSIWQADVENDFEKYVEAIKTANTSESKTKSADYNLDWAEQLFKLSDNFEALAEV